MTSTWSEPAFDVVARAVAARAGLTFAPERRESVENGIRRAMARAGVADATRYAALLAEDEALLEDLIGELTIGETYFFREPAQFRFLRQVVLPEIRARREDAVVRVWSAGCASGEEAYSLAMVLDQEGMAARSDLLATDISAVALEKARRASYAAWSFRDEGAVEARPFLRREGRRFVVADAIRRRVRFASLNLAGDDYPSIASGVWEMDLILCRNVLIYFDRETIRRVARRLYASMAEGGWLIAASSDPPLGRDAPFQAVTTEQGVFYRRGPAPAPKAGRTWSPPAPADPAPPRAMAATRDAVHATPAPAPAPVATGARAEPEDAVASARGALARGDYAGAIALVRDHVDDADACAVLVRALSNIDAAAAERESRAVVSAHPLSVELNHLRAVLLMQGGRDEEACRAARRVLYLDRSLAIAHFFLGSILRRRGDVAGASRAFRNARDLCAAMPDDAVVPLSDGEPAARLAEAARKQLARLGGAAEGRR